MEEEERARLARRRRAHLSISHEIRVSHVLIHHVTLASLTLAMTELANLTLFPATKEQIRIARRRSWVSWGNGLSVEQFVAKEEYLDVAEHARDGKMTVW